MLRRLENHTFRFFFTFRKSNSLIEYIHVGELLNYELSTITHLKALQIIHHDLLFVPKIFG